MSLVVLISVIKIREARHKLGESSGIGCCKIRLAVFIVFLTVDKIYVSKTRASPDFGGFRNPF